MNYLENFKEVILNKEEPPTQNTCRLEKNNQEVIDITKIRSFKEKYENTPFGREVFTSTEKEMIEYENQMKILMGEKNI